MSRGLLLVLCALLLPSCLSRESEDYIPTADGYRLSWNNVGAVPALYTRDGIGDRFDEAVGNAVTHLAKYGLSEKAVREMAALHRYIGYDAARFQIDASPTGWASGAYYSQSRGIVLAFWGRASGDVVPADAPAWTVYSWPTRPSPAFDWGYEPPPFPALGHELCHAFFGPQAEHIPGYPPVVGGFSVLGFKDWSFECVVQ